MTLNGYHIMEPVTGRCGSLSGAVRPDWLPYCMQHDSALWNSFCKLFGADDMLGDELAHNVVSLPGRMGGLGLRSAQRSASAAYWASWVSALAVITEKLPDVAADMVASLTEGEGGPAPCLQEASRCLEQLRAEGVTELPTWTEAAEGAKPPPPEEGTDAADLDRGWQCHASSTSENNFLESVVRPASDKPRRSLLLSQKGGPASVWLRERYRQSPLSPRRLSGFELPSGGA